MFRSIMVRIITCKIMNLAFRDLSRTWGIVDVRGCALMSKGSWGKLPVQSLVMRCLLRKWPDQCNAIVRSQPLPPPDGPSRVSDTVTAVSVQTDPSRGPDVRVGHGTICLVSGWKTHGPVYRVIATYCRMWLQLLQSAESAASTDGSASISLFQIRRQRLGAHIAGTLTLGSAGSTWISLVHRAGVP